MEDRQPTISPRPKPTDEAARDGAKGRVADAHQRIPGINVPDVLSRLNLSWGELRDRLRDFSLNHGQSLVELRGALDDGDHAAARRLAVEMGISGANFGASGLMEKSRALEFALRTGEKFYEHLYDSLEMEFSGLVAGVERLNGQGAIDDMRDVIRSLYDFAGLRAVFDDLQSRLRTMEWIGADAALKRVRELGIPPESLEGFRELEKLVRDRSAADALEMTGILKQNLD